MVDAQGTVAKGGDGVHVVAHDDHGRVPADHFSDARLTFSSEGRIAHRHDLVDEQHLGLQVRGDGEAKPGLHPHGIGPDRLFDVFTKFTERDDVLHAFGHFTVGQPEDASVEFDVLSAAQVALESRANARQQHAPASGFDGACIRPVNAGNQAQDGRFSGTVRSDDAEDFSVLDLEVDVVERPEAASPTVLAEAPGHLLFEVGWRSTLDREVEGDVLELNHAHDFPSQMLDGFRFPPHEDDASQHENAQAHQQRASDPFEFEQRGVAGHGRA